MVWSRFDADHFVPVRLLRFDPLGIGRQSKGDCENNNFLHAQVSSDSCTAPKSQATAPLPSAQQKPWAKSPGDRNPGTTIW
jgi:hypothetical protein